MKKQLMVPIVFALFAWILLPACGGNTNQDANLQEPTAQTEVSDTTKATANKEQGNEQGEDEADENDENEGKPVLTSATSTNAKTLVMNNLLTAFAGETTASAKYAAYAKKAQQEGFPEIALLFKTASKSEGIHAANHKVVLEDMGATIATVNPVFTVKTTKENLQDAIAGESYEISTMYPEFLTNANAVDNQLALISLNYAYKTEQKHKPLYEKALAALENNQVKTLPTQYYICPTCGNTYDTKAPKRCGVSMTSSERFIKIDKI